ncbi:primosomal protein N' [Alkalicoccus daliensis]|uniref:Replication restart protein PriA n=1 Tax=Alkalicoccus daliensis TaxID=745820 RepID=A0A1G9ZYQ1_9BACI|nr:primosomal protein N' [Alkalicoccus daliensis]SDN26214.1 replication restart DNA helicase PriA [Alkalicoccus daliensis]
MIVNVIVDVASQAVDRIFDYSVPEEMQETMSAGCRVHVPFANRPVQGFVIGIKESSEVPAAKLKPVQEQIDLTPPLTPELLQLAESIKEETLSLHVSVLKAMLPQAMRAKYKKSVFPGAAVAKLDQNLQKHFAESKFIENWDEWIKEASEEDKISAAKAIRKGLLIVEPKVTTKDAAKKQLVYASILSDADAENHIGELNRKAPKQAAVLNFLQSSKEEHTAKQLEPYGSKAALEALVKKGLISKNEAVLNRDPYEGRHFETSESLTLLPAQKEVLSDITRVIDKKIHRTFLIRGVTGSGKTEIYLQAIDKVLRNGKEAIVLVPEISLTPQMVERFKARFGARVAVLHSALSKGEKYDEWKKIRDKKVDVVVGARSAVFAPFENLGIIIIDEEHEASYKQEESPRYHARSVAISRAEHYNCPVLLGSATPSLDSYARAQRGVYDLLTLENRVNDNAMPAVTLVDMREELKSGNRSMFSDDLIERIKDRKQKGEQIVLLLNRRGYSTFIMCRECGYVPQCPHCDISLTYHRTNQSLQCHYCGHRETVPTRCPECDSDQIRFFGTGTQKVEEELHKTFEDLSIIRMDVDTTRRKGSHEKLLTAFGKGEADVLLGTQMIAKGLDFPNITLVGVLAADSMLHLPDFRAAERTFQLLTQVAGRAGRHDKTGEVLIQTYSPEHYSITEVKEHNFLSFYEKEMYMRKMGGYPPFYFLTMIHVSHTDLQQVVQVTEKMSAYLKSSLSESTKIFGPVASPIPRIKDRYRYQCMIKYKIEPKLMEALQELMHSYQSDIARTDLQIIIDTNPFMMM